MNIRQCNLSDAKDICDIYNYYIEHTVITFEEDVLSEAVIADRISNTLKNYPWLVLENNQGKLLGYAYATQWAERSAYKNTVEITVYLHHKESGNGYGAALYKVLLAKLSYLGFHTVVATIALPNEGSIKLQEAFGFKKVSHFSEVGRKFNRWVDVGHWQLSLTNRLLSKN